MRLVYIEWVDASSTRGPLSRKEGEEYEPLLVSTGGIMVNEDGEVVRVAQDYWARPDADGTVPETFRDISVIPKVLVKRMEVIEIESSARADEHVWSASEIGPTLSYPARHRKL